MDWQNVIVALLVIAAIAVVCRRAWSTFQLRKAGCNTGCGSCPATHSPDAKPIVTLDLTKVEKRK